MVSTLRAPFIVGKLPPLFKGGWGLQRFAKKRDVDFSIKMGIDKTRETCSAEILVLQGSPLCREARSAGKLVPQGNSFCRETRSAGKLVLVKQITCNTKVGEIISFCDFFWKTMQAAVMSKKKTPTTRGYFKNWRQRQAVLIWATAIFIAYLQYFW